MTSLFTLRDELDLAFAFNGECGLMCYEVFPYTGVFLKHSPQDSSRQESRMGQASGTVPAFDWSYAISLLKFLQFRPRNVASRGMERGSLLLSPVA